MRIKALFLLVVFLFNTGVGVNCALRACHDDCKGEISETLQHPVTSVEKPDPCCQGAVNSFASLAKLVPQSVKVFVPILTAYIRAYAPYVLRPVLEVKSFRQLRVDERQRPPTPNIRIAIQSFQV
jgi:hypothetical protein